MEQNSVTRQILLHCLIFFVPSHGIRGTVHDFSAIHKKFDLFLCLRRAIESNNQNSVEKLLLKGADPNIEVSYVSQAIMDRGKKSHFEPITLLGIALRHSSEGVLRRLLAAQANPNAIVNVEEYRPIHLAIDRGHLGMIKALVNRGARLDVVTRHGDSLLHHAISAHEVEALEYLVRIGADVQAKDGLGRSCLEATRDTWCRGCEVVIMEATKNNHR